MAQETPEEKAFMDKAMKLTNVGIAALIRGEVMVIGKFFQRYGWTGVWGVVGILALMIILQAAGVQAIFVLPLLFPFLLGALVFAAHTKLSNNRKSQAVPQSGVFFGMKAPTPTFWGRSGSTEPVTKPQSTDGHVLVVGGAGSGKSSCIAIPTLRDGWQASALVVDIKGELYEKSHRPHASVFNPLSASALGYDPFYLLKGSDNPIPDIREIALTLCPMEGAVKDPFWIQAAQNVLTGHLIFGWKSEASFTETIEVLQSVPPKKLLETEIKDKEAGRYLLQFADMDNRTLSSIMVELSNKVVAFATDPHITAILSKKDIITPELLEQGNDVFLQLPEYKLEQWKPMISLIVQQFSRHFEKRPDEGATPILFLLDEFARLGKMETVVHGLATLRSKKITIMPIIQSLAQLDATYGPDQRKIICDNCSWKVILGATDADSQKYFSALVGTYEKEKITTSYEGSGWFAEEKGTSKTTEEKPIIKPEEFAYLEDIVLLTPLGYRRVQKKPYYLNEPLVHVQPTSMQPAQEGIPERLSGNGQREPASQEVVPPEALPILAHEPHEQAATTQGNGQNRQSQKQQPVMPSSTSALQEQHQRYGAALRELAQSAPEGTPLSTIALTFAAKLPPEKQTDFLAWWQQHQNGKEKKS